MVIQTTIAAISLQPGDVIAWLVVGLIAGYLAGKVVQGRGFGCLGDIIVGLVGAFIGGFLASFFQFQGTYHFWGSIVIAFIGACILVALLRLISGGWSRPDRSY